MMMDADDSEEVDSHDGCDDGDGEPNAAIPPGDESDEGQDEEEIEEEAPQLAKNNKLNGKSRDTS